MKFFNKAMMMIGILSIVIMSCEAQINNAKTDTVKIYGNCGMCKKTIEKAGNMDSIAKVKWNKDTKMASITYNTTVTTIDKILQRIANAGYDSDAYTALDKAYHNLHRCCQYERPEKQ